MPRAVFLVIALASLGCGCVPSSVGLACSATAPCPTGWACDTALPGGYCTAPCTSLGALGSSDLSDFTCATSATTDGGLAWAKNCFAGGCRTGYTCRPVDGGAPVAAGPAGAAPLGVCLSP
jgi:hypothetical protein